MRAHLKSIFIGAGAFLLCLLAWLAYQDHALANDIRQARAQQQLDAAAQIEAFKAQQKAGATH